MPKLVEGYNMFIWENEDGSVSHTGSFNASEWDDYLEKSGKGESGGDEKKPASKKAAASKSAKSGKED